jgi:PAS domain S-box-containing protein
MPKNPASKSDPQPAVSPELPADITSRLVLAIEQGPEGIAVVDMNGDIEYVNNAFAQMHGYTPDELSGKNLATFHTAEQIPAVNAANQQIKETGEFVGEIWHVRRDGSVFPTRMHNSLIKNDDGEAVGLLGTLRDISEMKQAEMELARSQERFRLAAQTISDLVYEWDIETNRLDWYGDIDAVLGYEAGEFPRTLEAWFQAIHPEDQLRLADSVEIHRTSTVPIFEEYRIQKKDGTYLYWTDSGSPVLGDDGRPRRWVGACLDTTQQKLADETQRQFEHKLFQAQKLESLGVLAGGIAHDFNNLLMGVLGNTDLAILELPPDSPAVDTIKAIQVAAQRCADLARHLLAYSGRGRFITEPINLSEVVAEMSHLLKTTIAKKITVTYDLADNLPAVEADATQLRQVIMNLITNAAESFGGDSGTISVATGRMRCDAEYLKTAWLSATSQEGQYIYFEVVDSGCGIREEDLDKIFDPFFTSKFTGRGLGLAAVLGIVRSHHGVFRIDSEMGRGSTFKVLFPANGKTPVTVGRQKDSDNLQGHGTVLLVDDEETVRMVGKGMLEQIGYQVILAENGLVAVQKFRERKHEIDIVLLDLTMPEMDGIETYGELRRLQNDVTIILSSGFNEEDSIHNFLDEKPVAFLQKPYRLDELITCLKSATVFLTPVPQDPGFSGGYGVSRFSLGITRQASGNPRWRETDAAHSRIKPISAVYGKTLMGDLWCNQDQNLP